MKKILGCSLRRGYAKYAALLNYLTPEVVIDNNRFFVKPNVFKPLDFGYRLTDYCLPGEHVLDMGCGCGIVSVTAVKRGCHVTAVDVLSEAIENSRLNCLRNGIGGVKFHVCDLFAEVSGVFDAIVCNPPGQSYLDYKNNDLQKGGKGDFLARFFGQAGRYLKEKGRIVLHCSKRYLPIIYEVTSENNFEISLVQEFCLRQHPLFFPAVLAYFRFISWRYVILTIKLKR
jgi:methylase of polypeptide subunit release factors